MQCTIGCKDYTLCDRVREDPARRAAFQLLAAEVFGLDFEPWYRMGYWGEDYIPHVLYQGDKAVSCVAVNRMPARLGAAARAYIQLGTVMTHPHWRGRGLACYLMEHVLKTLAPDSAYLFANDSAVGFYPRFGFHPWREVEQRLYLKPAPGQVARLDMERPRVRAAVYERVKRGSDLAFFEVGGPELAMFSLTGPLKRCVYVVNGALVVAEDDPQGLYCHGVYGTGDLQGAVAPLMRAPGWVRLGFTPRYKAEFAARPLREEDTTLMVRGDDPFEGLNLRFPSLSHA